MITSAASFRTFGPGAALVDLSDAVLERHLLAAEEELGSYLLNRGYPEFDTGTVAYQTAIFNVAAWRIIVSVRGANPTNPGHEALKMARDEAIAWVRDIQRGRANLVGSGAPARSDTGLAGVVPIGNCGRRGW
jgi:hypothetical protein